MNRAAWLLAFAPVATASCLATGEDDADSAGAFSISVSAADTALVLDLVNYPGTDVDTLDVAAGLDIRAAAELVLHRDGLDRHSPSTDDDMFGDLAELDAVKWVGDAALGKLVAFAKANPAPASVSVEGIAFTGWQAETAVWAANTATFAELDVDAALDARAARAIVDGRPHADLAHVAAAAYVGPAALRALRDRAIVWWPHVHGEPPPGPCTVAVAPRADGTASDMTELLSRATTGDWPFAEVVALAAPACTDLADPAHAAALIEALVATGWINWGYSPPVRPGVAGGFVAGGARFSERVGEAGLVIEDRVAEGRWVPTSSDDVALYEALPEMIETLTGAPAANPADFAELRLFISAEECSQAADALVEKSTGRIWVAHTFPRC